MEKITKTILVGSLCSLSGMTNYVAASGLLRNFWELAVDYFHIWTIPELKRLSPKKIKDLYNKGKISLDDFIKALIADDEGRVVSGFERETLEELGFIGALSIKFLISPGGEEYNKLLRACLTSPELRNVPVLAFWIRDEDMQLVKNCPTHNLSYDFVQRVMRAKDLRQIAQAFETFVARHQNSSNETLKSQARLLDSIFSDLNRFPAVLEIGSKEVILCGNQALLPPEVKHLEICDPNQKEATIREIYVAILAQSEFRFEIALAIMKQFLLGYRGQSGQVDAQHLVALPVAGGTGNSLGVLTDLPVGTPVDVLRNSLQSCPPCVMRFGEESGQWQLQSKTESTAMPGIYKLGRLGMQLVTSGCRFEFPEDAEIRENYSVTSILDQSNGQFQWRSPLRDNPPRKVIFYGGCDPASTH
ncbi:MAG: hypothetical protein LBF34_05190 [Puniceicoccales bacterium]|jgi:hypothetical protein|nr:hypothetical protein [Puniceicoccales bacterium]